MESGTRKVCENQKCRSTETPLWRKGWWVKDPITQKHRRVLLCNACGLKFRKGHYCNYCYEMYRDVFEIQHDNENNRNWVKCNNCMNWIHTQCCINNNGYRPLQGPETNRIYFCSSCNNKNTNNNSNSNYASPLQNNRRQSVDDLEFEVLNQGTVVSHPVPTATPSNFNYPSMGYPPLPPPHHQAQPPTSYPFFSQPSSIRVLNPQTQQHPSFANSVSYSYPPQNYSNMYEIPPQYIAHPNYAPVPPIPSIAGSTEDRKRKLSPRGSSSASSDSGDKNQEIPTSKKVKNDLLKYSLVDPMNLTNSPMGTVSISQANKMFPLPNISGKAIIEKMFEQENQDQTANSVAQQLPSFSSLIQQAENRSIKAEDDTK